MTGRGPAPDRCRGDRAVEVVPHQGNFGGFERGVATSVCRDVYTWRANRWKMAVCGFSCLPALYHTRE